MNNKSLLNHLSFTPVVFLCAMVSAADAQPACRSINNPSPGSVCYKDWQFDSRQRGEGGTKTHQQIVERVDPNSVIIDTEVIVEQSNGITTRPSPNIVSSKGNLSIINETSSSIRELTEVKNSLQAKAAGCVPPVCGQVQNQLDAVNQKISEYSERKRVAIEAGGNEKILFSWTTKVECSKLGICGPGATMKGKIRVYERYLGNPSAIRQESLSLVGSSQVIIRSVPSTAYFNYGGAVRWYRRSAGGYCGITSPTHLRVLQTTDPAPSLGDRSPSEFGRNLGVCPPYAFYFNYGGGVLHFSSNRGGYCAFTSPGHLQRFQQSNPAISLENQTPGKDFGRDLGVCP